MNALTSFRWENLPQEMRERPQWCVAGPDQKGTFKAPYIAGTSRGASSTNPKHWCDFETATSAAQAAGPQYGIGYMLHKDDPFTVIDLDVKPGITTQEQLDRMRQITEWFDSYTETSQSGNGVHIVVRGKLGQGCRRDGVEMYSQERFIVCTGNAVIDKDIGGTQDQIELLAREMRRNDTSIQLEEVESDLSDAEIYGKLSSAVNGEKFIELCKGDWKGMGYPSQSEADLALMSMLCFHSKSNEQCRRLFRMTGLGKRDKALKDDVYLNRTLKIVRGRQARDKASVEHGASIAETLIANYQKNEAPSLAVNTFPAEEKSGAELLEALSVDWGEDIDAEVPDIVSGLVADEDVTLLGGHGGVGKSFLAMQMACAVAIGNPILNHGTNQSRVMYYSAEDGKKRLIRRLKNMSEAFSYDSQILKKNLVVVDASELEPLYGESPQNVGNAHRPNVVKMLGPKADFCNLQKMVEAFDPKLLIVDGASDTFDGNEIARRDVRAFIKLLRRVHPKRKIGVLVTVHIDRASARGAVSNDDGYAGSGQWHNSCRRRMYLQVKKEKGEDGEEIGEKIMLRVMKNQDGIPVPDMEIERGSHGLWQLAAPFEDVQSDCNSHEHDEKILKLIADYYKRENYISTSLASNASTGVYATLKGDKEFPPRLGRGRTTELIRQLERDGRLMKEPYRRAHGGQGERWKVV